MNLSQMQEDMVVLKSCIDSIVEVFSPPPSQLPDPTHQHQQRLHLQPKRYDTSEDVKRARDWAISVVECGVNTRNETIKVNPASSHLSAKMVTQNRVQAIVRHVAYNGSLAILLMPLFRV